MKKRVVMSIGGSLIVPEKIDTTFLRSIASTVARRKDYQFILVAGGGSTARKYMAAAKALKKSEYLQSLVGIAAINLNARLLTSALNLSQELPQSVQQIKHQLQKRRIIVVGALSYEKNVTSDSLAAHLAHNFHAPFINLTNVPGLFTEDPRIYKKAKLIRSIAASSFLRIAAAMKFSLGQHFVLDQHAASIIKKFQVPTYIVGKDGNNLNRLLNHKSFRGTFIHP